MPPLPIPRLQAGAQGFGRRASPEDFGAAEGAALQGAGGLAADIGDAVARVGLARQQARLARVAAETAAGFDEDEATLQTDPDLDTHEERWEKAAGDRLKAAQAQLPSGLHGELEDRLFGARAQGRARVRNNVVQKGMEQGRADLAAAGQTEADRAARATDDRERDAIRGGHLGALARAQAGGLITQAQHDAAVKDFDRTVSGADLRQIIAADPLGALTEMDDESSGILRGYDAAEAEVWKEQARDQYRQQLGERRAARNEARANLERAEREADEEATKTGEDFLTKGDLRGLQAHVAQHRDVLSDEHYRYFQDAIRGGGKTEAASSIPELYSDLSTRATRGENVTAEADAAYHQRRLSRADYDRVLAESQGRRFGDAKAYLKDRLKTDDIVKLPDSDMQARAADAIRAFDDFVKDNPDASRSDVQKYADELVKYVGVAGLVTAPPPLYSPPGSTPDEIEASAAARFEAGEMSARDRDDELERAERLREEQERAGTTGGGK